MTSQQQTWVVTEDIASTVPNTELQTSVVENFSLNETFLTQYLEHRLGPQKLEFSTLIPITIVYTVIFVTGIIGNLSTCIVIVRSHHLQTATNYYLFSLAIADIVTLILEFMDEYHSFSPQGIWVWRSSDWFQLLATSGLPNDLWVYWRQYPYIFGSVVCSLRALVSEMTSNASVLTIVAFTVERYLAICHPLYKQKMSNLPRVVKIIAALWVTAFTSALPFAVLTTISYVDYPVGSGQIIRESAFCAMSVENNKHNMPLLLFSSCVFFVLPMFFIVVLYAMIGLAIRRSKMSRLASESYSGNGRQQYSRKVLKLLVSVVIVFFVCWAPFHAQRLLFVSVDAEEWTDAKMRDVNEKLYHVAGCFYYFNCTTNPILYNVISDKYRRAFRDTLCCCCYPKRTSMVARLRNPSANHNFSFSSSYTFSLKDQSPRPTGRVVSKATRRSPQRGMVWSIYAEPRQQCNGPTTEKEIVFTSSC